MTIRLQRPLVYVTRDIERALGREPGDLYFILSNDTTYGRSVREQYPEHVMLVETRSEDGSLLDTYDLLTLPAVAQFIAEKKADVLVFQNTSRIERLAADRGWHLLNPRAELARTVEEKISQVRWLGKDATLLPPHTISPLKDVSYAGSRMVIQFNHAHTGTGTYIINSAEELQKLAEKFPERACRVTDFIDGPVMTVNATAGFFPRIGSISYQITGLTPFTDGPFSTIGNDWSVVTSGIATPSDCAVITSMVRRIGKKLARDGWKGLFGIDVIKNMKDGHIYLLEINARQAASVSYESQLEKKTAIGNTIFDAHLASLTGRHFAVWGIVPIKTGSQIIQRVTKRLPTVDVSALAQKGLSVIPYENTSSNQELFRIQASEGIMASHGTLNPLGQFIASCIH